MNIGPEFESSVHSLKLMLHTIVSIASYWSRAFDSDSCRLIQ